MGVRKDSIYVHLAKQCGILVVSIVLLCDVTDCANTTWCPKSCDCYNQYTTVECTKQGLTRIPTLSNLTTFLFLDQNSISELHPNAFGDTPNLVKLHVQNGQLTLASSASFCGLHRLQELHLGDNKLTSFPVVTNPDCILYELKEFSLHGNSITEIPRNLSKFAPNLEILNLSNNQLQTVVFDESFAELHSLENLDFSLNEINTIDSHDFDPVRQGHIPLEILRFSGCRLAYADPDAFRGLENLTALTLTQSLISVGSVFSHLDANKTRLAHLDLSEMYLPKLTVGMLGMFPKLILLKAIDSSISFIEPELFHRLQNLETLHIEHNHIERLDNIAAATKLRRLYLSFNGLSELRLDNLTYLEVVDLSHNMFSEIPSRWLTDVNNMLKLNLSYNPIFSIESNAFTQIPLNILDLSFNMIKELRPFGSIRLRKLDISHNGLTTVSDDTFLAIAGTIGEIDLSFNQMSELPLRIFLEFDHLQRLSLSHNSFGTALHSGQLKNLFSSLGHLQELDLSFNGIQSLPPEQLRSLHHLTTLLLRGNQISDLKNLHLGDLPSLAKLILADNQLTAIQTDVLNQIGFLEVVDLSENPYECSCAIYPFLHWLESTKAIVLNLKDNSNYQCDFPPEVAQRYILDPRVVPDSSTCPRTTSAPAARRGFPHNENIRPASALARRWTIIGAVIGGVIALCISITLVLYFGHVCQRIKSLHYRWQVRYREVSGVEIAGDIKA